jgi:hypothetical protein
MSIIYGNHFTDTSTQTINAYEPSLIFYEATNLIDKPINELNSDELLHRIKLGFEGSNQQSSLEYSIENNIPILLPDLTLNSFVDPQIIEGLLGFLLTSDALSPVFAPIYDKLVADSKTATAQDSKKPETIKTVAKLLLTAPPISESLLMFSSDRRLKNTIRTINNKIFPFLDTLKGQGRDIVFAAKMHMLVDNQVINDDNSLAHWGQDHILQPLLTQDTDSLYKLIHDNRQWLKMFYTQESLCNIVQFTDIKANSDTLSGKMEIIHLNKMEELLKD